MVPEGPEAELLAVTAVVVSLDKIGLIRVLFNNTLV